MFPSVSSDTSPQIDVGLGFSVRVQTLSSSKSKSLLMLHVHHRIVVGTISALQYSWYNIQYYVRCLSLTPKPAPSEVSASSASHVRYKGSPRHF